MTTTKINVMTPVEKERVELAELERQVRRVLWIAGGYGNSMSSSRTFTRNRDKTKRKFDGSQFDSLTDPSNRDIGAHAPYKKQRRE